MPTFLKKIERSLLLTLMLVIGLGLAQVVSAFSPAQTDSPPGNNSDAPLTISASPQTKAGALKVGGTGTPNVKASLEVGDAQPTGAGGGLLLPRVTTTQRNTLTAEGIANPSLTGLQIYNTELKQTETFNGTNWIASSATSTTAGTDGPAFFAYASSTSVTGVSGWNDFGAIPGSNFTREIDRVPGEFAVPSSDFTPTTGVFRPSVPGNYILTFSQWSAYGVAICKNSAAPSGVTYEVPAGCAMAWATTYGAKVSAVFSANGTTDSFKVWVYFYTPYSSVVQGGTSRYTQFSGSRIGNAANIVQQDNATSIPPEPGAVVFFQLNDCPSGWSFMDGSAAGVPNMRGMYVVGSAGSSVGQSPAGITPLTDRQNRPAGIHTHTVPSLGVTATAPAQYYIATYHYLDKDTWYAVAVGGNAWPAISMDQATPSFVSDAPASTDTGTITGGTTWSGTYSTGSAGTPGTNAPYIQLLACQKNP